MDKYSSIYRVLITSITAILIILLGCIACGPDIQEATIDHFLSVPVSGSIKEIAIDGDNIVWLESSAGLHAKYVIKLYDLDMHTTCDITGPINPGNEYYWNLDIKDNLIVWNEYTSETGFDIWAYDLDSKEKYPVCTGVRNQQYPCLAGNYILWREDEPHETYTHFNYFYYDLTTRTIHPVVFEEKDGVSYAPQFEGDIVAWQGIGWIYWKLIGFWENADTDGKITVLVDRSPKTSSGESSGGDIIVYDYENKSTFELAETWSYIHRVAVSDGLIVWTEGDILQGHSGPSDMYGYDLLNKEMYHITNDGTSKGEIAIDNNTIVWGEGRTLKVVKVTRK